MNERRVVTVAPFLEEAIAASTRNVVFATAEEREVALATLALIEREAWIPETGGLYSEASRARMAQEVADGAPSFYRTIIRLALCLKRDCMTCRWSVAGDIKVLEVRCDLKREAQMLFGVPPCRACEDPPCEDGLPV